MQAKYFDKKLFERICKERPLKEYPSAKTVGVWLYKKNRGKTTEGKATACFLGKIFRLQNLPLNKKKFTKNKK
jgi:hypothetical protein